MAIDFTVGKPQVKNIFLQGVRDSIHKVSHDIPLFEGLVCPLEPSKCSRGENEGSADIVLHGSSRAHPLFSKLKMNGSSRALLWEGVLFKVSDYKMNVQVNDQKPRTRARMWDEK